MVSFLTRYRRDGVIFDPDKQSNWQKAQSEESDKQNLLDKMTDPSKEMPADSFSPREEVIFDLYEGIQGKEDK